MRQSGAFSAGACGALLGDWASSVLVLCFCKTLDWAANLFSEDALCKPCLVVAACARDDAE